MTVSEANPYRVPSSGSSDGQRFWKMRSIALGLIYVYPLLVVAAIYGSWIASYVALGHRPIPYLEYPSNAVIDFLGYGGFLLILCGPVAIPTGILTAYRYPFSYLSICLPTQGHRFVSVFIYIAFVIALWAAIVFDPWRVVDWYFD